MYSQIEGKIDQRTGVLTVRNEHARGDEEALMARYAAIEKWANALIATQHNILNRMTA